MTAANPLRAAPIFRRLAWTVVLSAPVAAPAHTGHEADLQVAPAPGYGELGFEAPAPGSYALPALGAAADGTVIDSAASPRRLHELYAGKLVLLSFIYTSCSDVNGCPLATWVLGRVQKPILAHPLLKERVRILSLSFDPGHDTPAVMAEYGSRFREPGFDWQFLTTTGPQQLRPVLDAYGQWMLPERDAGGRRTGGLSHLLRVYLIDEQRRIRNIYNANFLHPDILVNDLLTLLGMEARQEPKVKSAK